MFEHKSKTLNSTFCGQQTKQIKKKMLFFCLRLKSEPKIMHRSVSENNCDVFHFDFLCVSFDFNYLCYVNEYDFNNTHNWCIIFESDLKLITVRAPPNWLNWVEIASKVCGETVLKSYSPISRMSYLSIWH